MTKEEYNAIVGMVELLGYQYCERNKIKFGTDTEFKRGLNEALKVMKKYIECPLHHVVIDRKDNIVDLSEVWKDGKKEKPIPCSDIVIRDCCITSNYEDVVDESQWAYLDDLLPKGGE